MSDFGNLWNDNADLPAKPVVTDDIDPELLRVNLGQVSQFVGLMDTIDKVREHLAQVAQYQTVQMNLIEDLEHEDVQVCVKSRRSPEAIEHIPSAPRGRPANPERAEWVARLAAATEDWREAVKRRKDMDDEVRDLRERMRRIEENPPT